MVIRISSTTSRVRRKTIKLSHSISPFYHKLDTGTGHVFITSHVGWRQVKLLETSWVESKKSFQLVPIKTTLILKLIVVGNIAFFLQEREKRRDRMCSCLQRFPLNTFKVVSLRPSLFNKILALRFAIKRFSKNTKAHWRTGYLKSNRQKFTPVFWGKIVVHKILCLVLVGGNF